MKEEVGVLDQRRRVVRRRSLNHSRQGRSHVVSSVQRLPAACVISPARMRLSASRPPLSRRIGAHASAPSIKTRMRLDMGCLLGVFQTIHGLVGVAVKFGGGRWTVRGSIFPSRQTHVPLTLICSHRVSARTPSAQRRKRPLPSRLRLARRSSRQPLPARIG